MLIMNLIFIFYILFFIFDVDNEFNLLHLYIIFT